jgi:hypothetical protein
VASPGPIAPRVAKGFTGDISTRQVKLRPLDPRDAKALLNALAELGQRGICALREAGSRSFCLTCVCGEKGAMSLPNEHKIKSEDYAGTH